MNQVGVKNAIARARLILLTNNTVIWNLVYHLSIKLHTFVAV